MESCSNAQHLVRDRSPGDVASCQVIPTTARRRAVERHPAARAAVEAAVPQLLADRSRSQGHPRLSRRERRGVAASMLGAASPARACPRAAEAPGPSQAGLCSNHRRRDARRARRGAVGGSSGPEGGDHEGGRAGDPLSDVRANEALSFDFFEAESATEQVTAPRVADAGRAGATPLLPPVAWSPSRAPLDAVAGVVCSAPPHFTSPLPPLAPTGDAASSAGGLAIAAVAVIAARLGRHQSERDRIGLGYWQRRQQWLESAAGELHAARLAYERGQAERRSKAEAEMRATAEEARRAAEQRRREQEEAREAQRAAEAALERMREEYEAKEREMRAEMDRREREARDAVRRRYEEQRDKERREVEEKRERGRVARAEREAREREEEERREREVEERRVRIRSASTRLTLPLSGSVEVAAAPIGTLVDPTGIDPTPATLQVTVRAGTLSGGTDEEVAYFRDRDDAMRRSGAVCGGVADKGVAMWVGAAGVKGARGEGPLQGMDELERNAWARAARVRGGVALQDALLQCLSAFRGREPLSRKVDIPTVHLRAPITSASEGASAGGSAGGSAGAGASASIGVDGVDGDVSVAGRMREARVLVQEGRGAEAARFTLMPLIRDQADQLSSNLSLPSLADPALRPHIPDPALAAAPLTLAHWLARVMDERPGKEVAASPWFEASVALARAVLKGDADKAEEGALVPVSDCVARVLGDSHPISREVERLARERMGAEERRRREAQRAADEERRVQRMLDEEWPEYSERARMRVEAAEEATPLPEKAWALRNVALACGDEERARDMLRMAVGYMERHVQGDSHPALLLDLLHLAEFCEARAGRSPDWAEEAKNAWRRVAGILLQASEAAWNEGVVERAALLALAAAGQCGGAGDEELRARAEDRGRSLLERLPAPAQERVQGALRAGGVVRGMAEEFAVRIETQRNLEKELAKRQSAARRGKL